jgi:hypothetical protein
MKAAAARSLLVRWFAGRPAAAREIEGLEGLRRCVRVVKYRKTIIIR